MGKKKECRNRMGGRRRNLKQATFNKDVNYPDSTILMLRKIDEVCIFRRVNSTNHIKPGDTHFTLQVIYCASTTDSEVVHTNNLP